MNAPQRCEISSPVVDSTGDDGILVGETVSPKAGNVFIDNARISNCGGNGICVSVPRGRITGRIRRTNQSGVALQRLQGTEGSDIRLQVEIDEAGQLQAGEIGRRMIPKYNPYGVWIYQSGGRIDLDGTVVRKSYAAGINLQVPRDGTLSHIVGRVELDTVCEDMAGQPSGGKDQAALRRSATGRGTVSDIKLDLLVKNSKCPLVAWYSSGSGPDERIDLQLRAEDLQLDETHYGRAGVLRFARLEAAPGAGVRAVKVALRSVRSRYGKTLAVADNIDADQIEVDDRP